MASRAFTTQLPSATGDGRRTAPPAPRRRRRAGSPQPPPLARRACGQLAVEERGSLPHPAQPQTWRARRGRGITDGIADPEPKLPVRLLDVDRRTTRCSVADCVREALLHDPIRRVIDRPRNCRSNARCRELADRDVDTAGARLRDEPADLAETGRDRRGYGDVCRTALA